MAKKPASVICKHEKYNDPSITWWKATQYVILVPEDIYEIMESRGDSFMMVRNDIPGLNYTVSFKKFEDRESKPDSKY